MRVMQSVFEYHLNFIDSLNSGRHPGLLTIKTGDNYHTINNIIYKIQSNIFIYKYISRNYL